MVWAEDQQDDQQAPSTIIPAPPANSVYTPLTVDGKFHYYVRSTFGGTAVLRSVAMAGVNSWRDHPPEWGQGMEGYGRRLASKFSHHTVKRTIQFGVGVALHEDPRYFPSEQQGFWPRTRHAVVHTFVTPRDDGTKGLAISRLAGAFGGALISRTWQPERNRTVKDGFKSAGITLSLDTSLRVLHEFWPDIKRRLGR